MVNTLLNLKNISKIYNTVKDSELKYKHSNSGDVNIIFENLSLELYKQKIIAIVGESGSGKSTLLHIAAGLDVPNFGRVVINDQDITHLDETKKSKVRMNDLGFMYQHHYLLGNFSVIENIMMPIYIKKGLNIFNCKDHSYFREKARVYLKLMNLDTKENAYPNKLSGGEQQRVAFIRSVIHEPKVLLADEPTGNLDHKNADIMFNIIFSYVEKENVAALIVTHSKEIADMCHHTYELKNGVLYLIK